MTSGASTLLSNVSVTGGYLTGGLTSNLLPLTQSVDFTVTNHSSLVWNGGQSLGFSNGSNPLPIASGGMLSASAGAVVVLSNLNISGQYVSGNGGVLVRRIRRSRKAGMTAIRHDIFPLGSISHAHLPFSLVLSI